MKHWDIENRSGLLIATAALEFSDLKKAWRQSEVKVIDSLIGISNN